MTVPIVSPQTDKNLRSENQDVFGHFETPYGPLFVVADGMGGRKGGRKAANLTTRGVLDNLIQAHNRGVPVGEALVLAANQTGRDIFFQGQSGDGMTIAHVGDSRAYHVTQDGTVRLTKDHTQVQEWLDAGVLTEKEAENHPESCMITRAMGVEPDVQTEVRPETVCVGPNEGLLLCSDGLSSFVEDELIFDCIHGTKDKRRCADRLVSLAKACQSDDNITVLYLHVPKKGVISWGKSREKSGYVGKVLTIFSLAVCFALMAFLGTWFLSRHLGQSSSGSAQTKNSETNPETLVERNDPLRDVTTHQSLIVLALCLAFGSGFESLAREVAKKLDISSQIPLDPSDSEMPMNRDQGLIVAKLP